MTITIAPDDTYIVESKDAPVLGRSYNLEDAACGTGAQNRLFHALLDIYYKSGAWSYQGSGYNQGATYGEFRNMVKRKLGAGFEAFVYAEIVKGKPVIKDAKTYADIPASVRADPALKQIVRGRLKSWIDYSKSERRRTIDLLFAEMDHVGVRSEKLEEIRAGLDRAFNANV